MVTLSNVVSSDSVDDDWRVSLVPPMSQVWLFTAGWTGIQGETIVHPHPVVFADYFQDATQLLDLADSKPQDITLQHLLSIEVNDTFDEVTAGVLRPATRASSAPRW